MAKTAKKPNSLTTEPGKGNETKLSGIMPYARKYGFNLVPLGSGKRGKIPTIKHLSFYFDNMCDFEELKKHKGNIGVITGGISNLVVFDIDSKKMAKELPFFKKDLNRTFSVESVNGFHIYYNVEGGMKTDRIDFYKPFLGEVQVHHLKGEGGYVVAAFSLHYDKEGKKDGVYQLFCDKAPITLTKEEVNERVEIIKNYALANGFVLTPNFPVDEPKKINGLPNVEKVYNLAGFVDAGHGEIKGPSPIHGSGTGQNFWVNPEKGLWRCWRHESGGTALNLLAVKYGLVECSDCKPGALKGEKFRELAGKIKTEFNIDISSHKGGRSPWLVENNKGVLVVKPGVLAKHITEQEDIITNSESSVSFIYEKGLYEGGKAKIRAIAQSLVPVEIFQNRHKTEVESWIKDATGLTSEEIEERKPEGYVNLKNGLLNLNTFELENHRSDIISFAQVQVKYNPEAECRKFEKFLHEVLDSGVDIQTVQEFFGYTLIDGYPFQKALIFYGEGGTGKSTLINILGGVLGSKNISTETIQSISENRFRIAELFGKMANLCPDNPGGKLPDSAIFRAITGGDAISAEKKNTAPFHFVNTAKLLYSANELANPRDMSDAFFERFVILTCSNKFRGTAKEVKNLAKLLVEDEAEGILNWMVKGLKRLLERGEFSLNPSTEEIRDSYIKKANPIHAFFLNCIEEAKGEKIEKTKLYSAYVGYCLENKLPAVVDSMFAKNIGKESGLMIPARLTINNQRIHVWMNVSLKNNDVSEVFSSTSDTGFKYNGGVENVQQILGFVSGVSGVKTLSQAREGIKTPKEYNIKLLCKNESCEKEGFFVYVHGTKGFTPDQQKSQKKTIHKTEHKDTIKTVAKILQGLGIVPGDHGRHDKADLLRICNNEGLSTAEAITAIEELGGIETEPMGHDTVYDFSHSRGGKQ